MLFRSPKEAVSKLSMDTSIAATSPIGWVRDYLRASRAVLRRVSPPIGSGNAACKTSSTKGRMDNRGRAKTLKETVARERFGEAGIIIFGGGGGSGPGCLFWIIISIILSVTLTVIANLLFVVF